MNATQNMPDAGAANSPGTSLQHAADRLKAEGRKLTEDAKTGAETMARERKDVAARFLQDIGAATAKASEEMRNKGHDTAANFIDMTAEEISHFGREIDNRDITVLLRELQGFAQRRPMLFYGASLLAGFAAVRFLKASAQGESASYGAGRDEYGSPGPGGTSSGPSGPAATRAAPTGPAGTSH